MITQTIAPEELPRLGAALPTDCGAAYRRHLCCDCWVDAQSPGRIRCALCHEVYGRQGAGPAAAFGVERRERFVRGGADGEVGGQ